MSAMAAAFSLGEREAGLDGRRAVDEQRARRRAQRAVEASRAAVGVGRRQRAAPRRPARRGSAARCGSSRGSCASGATVYSRTSTGAASTICSKLSSTMSTRRPASACAMRSSRAASPLSRMPRRVRDRRQQQARLEHALERDEVDAVGEEVLGGARRLDREPALADPAGSDEADHPVVAAREQLAHLGEVALPADRRRCRARARAAASGGARPALRVELRRAGTRRTARRGASRGRRRPAPRARRRSRTGGRRRCRRSGCGRSARRGARRGASEALM